MIEKFINKILSYINDNYDVVARIEPKYLYENNVKIPTKEYDLDISIKKVTEDNYLFGNCEYYLSFNFEANKKYATRLQWHGGGYTDEYKDDDYSNMDKFLGKYCEKRMHRQLSIFDV